MREICVVAAITKDGGIGNKGNLPWSPKRLKTDMSLLRLLTINGYTFDEKARTFNIKPQIATNHPQNAIIMGRLTWESIPDKFKPMPDRQNIIVTSRPKDIVQKFENVQCAPNLSEAIKIAHGQIFILGGHRIYREALERLECKFVVLTEMIEQPPLEIDTLFPTKELLLAYSKHENITANVKELCKTAIPKSDQNNDGIVCEGEFKYSINVYTKKII